MLETGLFIGLGALAIVIAFAIYKYSYAQGEYDNFLKSLSEDDQKEFALFTTTGKWRDYMRIHNQTMIERELERRDLLRRVAALREDLNRAYEPLNIVRPRFGNNVRPRIRVDRDQDLADSGPDFLHFPFLRR